MPPPLTPDTAFYIGRLYKLYSLFVKVQRLKYEQSLSQPVNHNIGANIFANSQNLRVGEILDALHVTRDCDRVQFIAQFQRDG